jgi:integrase
VARTVKDAKLSTREARIGSKSKLRVQGKPHYCRLEEGLHLGYRKLGKDRAGTWLSRIYLGNQTYTVEKIGSADDFSDADGVVILSFDQAQTAARERMVKRAHHAAGKSGPVMVADVLADYLVNLEMRGLTTSDARYRIDAFVLPKLGDAEVESLTAKQLQTWLAGVAAEEPRVRTRKGDAQRHRKSDDGPEAKRARRSTANRTWSILRAALRRYRKTGPWADVEQFAGVDTARTRFLTVTEAQRLINACDPGFRPLVQAALASGCRYGELIRLVVSDFHADSGTIAIRQSKSGKPRHVILTAEGTEFFAQQCVGKSGTNHIFTNGGGRPWQKSNQLTRMRQACTRAEISPPISFHGTRRTYASLCAMAGMDLRILAQNLGHSDPAMTIKHYAHLSPSYVTDMIRAKAPTFGLESSNVRRIG